MRANGFIAATILIWALALGIIAYSAAPPTCDQQLRKLGHVEAVAIQVFQRAPVLTGNGTTPAHDMFQAAADYLRIEHGCK
jgi:hypothetical protein